MIRGPGSGADHAPSIPSTRKTHFASAANAQFYFRFWVHSRHGRTCRLSRLGRKSPEADLRTMAAIESNRMSILPLIPAGRIARKLNMPHSPSGQTCSITISRDFVQAAPIESTSATTTDAWRIYGYTSLAAGRAQYLNARGDREDHLCTRTDTRPTSAQAPPRREPSGRAPRCVRD